MDKIAKELVAIVKELTAGTDYPEYPKVNITVHNQAIHVQTSTTGDPEQYKKVMSKRLDDIRKYILNEIGDIVEIPRKRQDPPFELSSKPGVWHWHGSLFWEDISWRKINSVLTDVSSREWK